MSDCHWTTVPVRAQGQTLANPRSYAIAAQPGVPGFLTPIDLQGFSRSDNVQTKREDLPPPASAAQASTADCDLPRTLGDLARRIRSLEARLDSLDAESLSDRIGDLEDRAAEAEELS
jgi:hypothetical protein